jgi:hypothetical protein
MHLVQQHVPHAELPEEVTLGMQAQHQAQHQQRLHQPYLCSQLQPALLSKYKSQALLLLLLSEPCRQLWPLLQQQVSWRPLVKSVEAEQWPRLWMRNLLLGQVRSCLLPKQAQVMTWMGH